MTAMITLGSALGWLTYETRRRVATCYAEEHRFVSVPDRQSEGWADVTETPKIVEKRKRVNQFGREQEGCFSEYIISKQTIAVWYRNAHSVRRPQLRLFDCMAYWHKCYGTTLTGRNSCDERTVRRAAAIQGNDRGRLYVNSKINTGNKISIGYRFI